MKKIWESVVYVKENWILECNGFVSETEGRESVEGQQKGKNNGNNPGRI